MLRPTVGSGLVISWSGMRGIVSLPRRWRSPPAFPYRDLIVFTAFIVVLGTLVIQGMTLKPLLHASICRMTIRSVAKLRVARDRALKCALVSFAR